MLPVLEFKYKSAKAILVNNKEITANNSNVNTFFILPFQAKFVLFIFYEAIFLPKKKQMGTFSSPQNTWREFQMENETN